MASGRPIICLVTDLQRFTTEDQLVRLAARAGAAGVDIVQIRERRLDDRQLYALTQRIVSAVHGTGARVVVNDRTDVALAARADGVHLRADSVSAERIRRVAPPGFLIGRSVHSIAEATAAAGAVDYLVMGTVFATPSKGGTAPLAGLAGLAAVCRAVDVPVLAIGGVTADKLDGLAAAGAAGIAAIGLFSDAVNTNSQGDLDALQAVVAKIRRAFAAPSPP